MLTKTAIEHFGGGHKGVVALANALGITASAVYQWGKYVPEGRAYKLQVITAGALRVEPAPVKEHE